MEGIVGYKPKNIEYNPDWIRPFDRPVVPTISSGEQVIYFLFGAKEFASNDLAFKVQGNYIVDWGDGVVEELLSGSIAQHQYTYASLTTTVSSENVKWVWIKVSPATGSSLTVLDTVVRPTTQPTIAAHIYVPQVYEMYIQSSELTNLNMRMDQVARYYLLNVFHVLGTHKLASLFTVLYSACYNLKSLYIDFTTVTNLTSSFNNASSFNQDLGKIVTKATSLTSAFAGLTCYNKKVDVTALSCGDNITSFFANSQVPEMILELGTTTSLVLGTHYNLSLLRIRDMKPALANISVINSAITADGAMKLLEDLYDRTGLAVGTLTLTNTKAAMDLTTEQKDLFAAKNWTLIL